MMNLTNWQVSQAQPQPSLLDFLQRGGYIFYTRHADATVGSDQPTLNLQDCSTQRNLSNFGRSQAITYGETIRRLGIPIMYPVITSPFCRARETAALAFGENYVQIDPFWVDIYNLSANLTAEQQARTLYNLQSVLEVQPALGSNQFIIAHSFPPYVGLGSIPNMGMVVVRPHGQGNGYEVVAHLTLEDLQRLGG